MTENANYHQQSKKAENKQDFLNSEASEKSKNKYRSPCTRARLSSERLKVTWRVGGQSNVEVVVEGEHISDRRKIFRNVRNQLRKRRTLSLRGHLHQGKTNHCIAMAKASYHFFQDGRYTTFKDWRFVHRARLCLTTKLNRCNFSSENKDKRCKKCGKEETLPHVLNHCTVHSTPVQEET